jgi:cyanophycinase
MKLRQTLLVVALLGGSALGACNSAHHFAQHRLPLVTEAESETRVGPPQGALVVVGGGQIGSDIVNRFVQLAGGARARIVVIPTAVGDSIYGQDWAGALMFRRAGVKNLTILHAPTRAVADQEEFVLPIRNATGVWFPGGRQFRLADSYLNTRTLSELHALLGRGGVIGGTSAGASIQASYLIRGSRETNTLVMAPGYEQGFGFLHDAAVDQHLSQRGRQNDMLRVIERYPSLLGIGLDEGTAIVVRGDTAEVIGPGRVAFYNTDSHDRKGYFWLGAGERFNLNRRNVMTDK